MHPHLVHFNIISGWDKLVASEETAIKFLSEVGLIPARDSLMFCHKCGSGMYAISDSSRKVKFRFVCKNRTKTPKCLGAIQPLQNTFFENTRIPFRDSIAIMILYVYKLTEKFAHTEICEWRKSRNEGAIKLATVEEYYGSCRDVEAVLESRKSEQKGSKTPSSRRSRGEMIYDFLMAVKEVYPGPGKVGVEVQSLFNKSPVWNSLNDMTELNNSESLDE